MEPGKLRYILKKGAVLVVQLTPFTENDEVDVEGIRGNTRFLVEKRHCGPLILVPTGSTGEHYALTEEERRRVIKTVVDEANGKVPVIAGTGHSGTRVTIEFSKYAEDVGAEGVMVVLPYYHVPEEEGLCLHYQKVAEEINVGILIYNNADVSKVYIKPHLMTRIASNPKIVGVKENTPFLQTFYEQVKAVGGKIPILQGRGEFWFAVTALLGARGYISGYANFMPEFCIDLLSAGLNGNFRSLREILERLAPYEEFIARMSRKYGPSSTILPYPYVGSYMIYGVMKATLDMLGLSGKHMRLPLLDLRDEDKVELQRIVFDVLGLSKIG